MGLSDLFKPKWQHSDYNVRQAAVKNPNFTDQTNLAIIAKIDEDRDVRKAAVKKLTNQAVLAYVALNDKNEEVRRAAIERITDQGRLEDIASNAKSSQARMDAVDKLNDKALAQTIYADIAKNEKEDFYCKKAVKNLSKKDVLAVIAKNNKSSGIRMTAVENPNLTDQDVLAHIARNDRDVDVRIAAVDKLIDKSLAQPKSFESRNNISRKDLALNNKLIETVMNNNTDTVAKLIYIGADVNAKNEYGQTALYWAVNNANEETAEILIEKGANTNKINKAGESILYYTFTQIYYSEEYKKYVNFAFFILSKGIKCELEEWQKIINLIINDCGDCIFINQKTPESLLRKVMLIADKNSRNINGRSPLMLVYMLEMFELFEQLIINGADINVKDNNGDGLLMFRWKRNSYNGLGGVGGVNYLISKGANVNLSDISGNTLLFYVLKELSYHKQSWVGLNELNNLISKGADLNVKNNDGLTPLLFLKTTWETNVRKIFDFCMDEDVYASNCAWANEEEIKFITGFTNLIINLLEKGVDINAKDTKGESLLDWAKKLEKDDKNANTIVKLLISKGAV